MNKRHTHGGAHAGPLRILAVSALWQGADDYAFVRAFRRAGHSVNVVSEDNFIPPGWRHRGLRALRRLLTPTLVREFQQALIAKAEQLQPDLFFVFKGTYVTPEVLEIIRSKGAIAINFYPDVSFIVHSRYLADALPRYDWIFTTKTFGLADMKTQLGINNISFVPHGFDPETHIIADLDDFDRRKYECDISFIGTWSPKKQQYLERIWELLPNLRLRIWGSDWHKAQGLLQPAIEGKTITGVEYAKAIQVTTVNLAILSEVRKGASSGDQITSRTFHIPASGGFMIHERNDEAMQYFEEGKECAFFSGPDDLVAKINYYLDHPDERKAIAAAGHERSLRSGYSVDDRVETIITKYAELTKKQNALQVET